MRFDRLMRPRALILLLAETPSIPMVSALSFGDLQTPGGPKLLAARSKSYKHHLFQIANCGHKTALQLA